MKKTKPHNMNLHHCTLAVIVIWTFLAGCATPDIQSPPVAKMQELDRIKPQKMLEKAKHIRKPGPPPFKELMVPITKEASQPPVLYSLVFDKAPLGEIIAALTKDTEYNLSIEAQIDLAKAVTVNLKNVTLDEALDMIVVNGAGYAWNRENGTLFVKKFQERIYRLDFLDMVGETDIEVGGDMLGSGVEGAGVTGKYQVKAKKPTASSDVWASVEKALDGMKSGDGLLRVNRNAGVIYMSDSPRKIAAMVHFLDSLSESLNRQVFIEARIMEVVLSDENKYGIDWSGLNILFTENGGDLPDIFDLRLNGNGFIQKSGASAFGAMLDFLKTQGDVKILSNPHLLVMNRQSALLTVGRQLPYTEIDGVDRDDETNTVTIGASIRRAILGLQLGITPQISADGMITLHIVPTLTRVDQEVDIAIPTGLDSVQTISNPVIDLQELITMVRVREGQSIVLAGLIKKIKTLVHEGLPILGDLPWLGKLFKHIKTKEENSELVILITPYISEGSYAAKHKMD